MKNIKVLTTAITLLFVFSLYSYGFAAALDVSQDTVHVAIVYSTGGLGDQSFNDAAKRGIDALLAAHDELEVAEACESNCDIPDITSAIEDFASDTEVAYDLIIGIGFSAGDGITASAQGHADRNFMIIDSVIDEDNVASVTFKEHEGSFLVGALAAMVTNTNLLGFLGGLDIPLINKFGAGFEMGAKWINQDINVTVAYSPDPNNPWGDTAGGKTVANNFIEDGIDIIYAAAGGTGVGVIQAAEEKNEALGNKTYYAIGVDSDQDHISEGNVLTSMIKRVDLGVIAIVEDVLNDEFAGGELTELGVAEGGVGISAMRFTETEANATYSGSTTRWEEVQNLADEIADGDIVVVDNYDDLADVEYPAGQLLPAPTVPIFFGLVAVVAIVYRRRR